MTPNDLVVYVRQAQCGNREAWDMLVKSFYQRVHRYLSRRLNDPYAADDLTQEIFLHVFRKIGQLRNPRLFPAWLKIVVLRALHRATYRRWASLARNTCHAPQTPSARREKTLCPLELLEQRELVHAIRRAVAALSCQDRQTLEAFYFEGQTLRQMSLRLGCPLGTVKRRMHVARRRLAEKLRVVPVR
jgi:RNA polymerase sigma-70 factor (ECF subfamily)